MKSQHRSNLSRAAGVGMLALAAAFWLPGCGSSSKVESHGTSIGQELQDLDAARNKGLITEDEYNTKRRQIMNRK